MIKVFIVDDHELYRKGIISAIDKSNNIVVVGEASDGKEALRCIEKLSVDVYLFDIMIEHLNGIQLAHKVMEIDPDAKIILISFIDQESTINTALNIGIKGYILKSETNNSIVSAINTVYDGKSFFSPTISDYMRKNFYPDDKKKRPEKLTPTEQKILFYIRDGLKPGQIAKKLGSKVNTIKTHERNIRQKLGLKTKQELFLHLATTMPSITTNLNDME